MKFCHSYSYLNTLMQLQTYFLLNFGLMLLFNLAFLLNISIAISISFCLFSCAHCSIVIASMSNSIGQFIVNLLLNTNRRHSQISLFIRLLHLLLATESTRASSAAVRSAMSGCCAHGKCCRIETSLQPVDLVLEVELEILGIANALAEFSVDDFAVGGGPRGTTVQARYHSPEGVFAREGAHLCAIEGFTGDIQHIADGHFVKAALGLSLPAGGCVRRSHAVVVEFFLVSNDFSTCNGFFTFALSGLLADHASLDFAPFHAALETVAHRCDVGRARRGCASGHGSPLACGPHPVRSSSSCSSVQRPRWKLLMSFVIATESQHSPTDDRGIDDRLTRLTACAGEPFSVDCRLRLVLGFAEEDWGCSSLSESGGTSNWLSLLFYHIFLLLFGLDWVILRVLIGLFLTRLLCLGHLDFLCLFGLARLLLRATLARFGRFLCGLLGDVVCHGFFDSRRSSVGLALAGRPGSLCLDGGFVNDAARMRALLLIGLEAELTRPFA
ncbi:hypothetical protein KCU85_g252, partial [Aureobasidium melanogenum]